MLRPWVREEDTDCSKGPRRNTVDEIDRIALDHSDVAQAAALDFCQHRGNTRGMHVDPDDTFHRSQFSQFDESLAATEPDVENDVTVGPEHLVQRQLGALDREPPLRHRPFVRCDS